MAPKKTSENVPAAPILDSNPYGAFINVHVPSGEIHLVAKDMLLSTHLVISYSSEYAPISGSSTEPHDGKGVFVYDFKKPFRQEASIKGLTSLLNSTVKLAMHDSASGDMLASTELDFSPLAYGHHGYELKDVALTVSDPTMVLGAILHTIVITLTKREAPGGLEAAPPQSTPPANPRPSVSGARASIAGNPPPPTAEPALLTDPVPYTFLSEDDANESNVLEITLESLGPAPPGLIAASNLAKEGKAPGKLTVSLALVLPTLDPTAAPLSFISLPAGSVEADGSISFGSSGKIKEVLKGPQAKALLAAAEEGLPVSIEVARYLVHDQLQDNAWDHYHAHAAAEIAPLSFMGVSAVAFSSIPLLPFSASGSVLPPYASSNAKAKPIETVAPQALESGLGGWDGSTLSLTLKLSRPLVASWSPPPTPPAGLSVEALFALNLGAKTTLPSTQTSSDAMSEYKKLISSLAGEIKALSLNRKSEDGTPLNAFDLNAQLVSSGRYETMKRAIADAASRVALERYRKAHDSDLKPYPPCSDGKEESVVSIQPSGKLNQELLAVLVDVPFSSLEGESKKREVAKASKVLDDLSIANECELMGRVKRAQSVHQRRILKLGSSEDKDIKASTWYDYGAFCMRARQPPPVAMGSSGAKDVGRDPSLSLPPPLLAGRGEQCFREGLIQSPSHLKCLFALSASLLEQARVTDTLFLSEATERARDLVTLLQSDSLSDGADPNKKSSGNVSLAQALTLLALCHDSAASEGPRDSSLTSAISSEDPATDARLSTASLLMDLGLPSLADSALGLAGGLVESAVSPASSPDLFLLYSLVKAHARGTSGHPDSYEEAIDLLTELLEDHLPGSGAAIEEEEEEEEAYEAARRRNAKASQQCSLIAKTLGHVHFEVGKFNEAIRAYRTARDMSKVASSVLGLDSSAEPELYARLARAYLFTNHKAYSHEVFRQASAASQGRSAWAWVGAGACLLSMGSKDEATACFDEALTLDPEDPETWARLAMSSFEKSREGAGACLKTAVRYGLEDPLLLSELSSVYGSKDGGESGRRVATNLQNLIQA